MTIRLLSACALGFASLFCVAASAQECTVSVAPEGGSVLGELIFLDFGEHREVQIDTPSQPQGLAFAAAIDGEARDDILLLPGMDDLLLSLTPADGELALDGAFLIGLMAGETLTVTSTLDGKLEEEASYDLTALAAGIAECGIG